MINLKEKAEKWGKCRSLCFSNSQVCNKLLQSLNCISAKYYGQSVVKVVADLEYMISVMFVTGDEDWCESECDPTTRTATRTSKKSIALISKTTTSHVRHAFLHISFLFFHNYDVKMPNFAVKGGPKQATTKFYFSVWAWLWFLEIQLQEGSPTFDKVSG